MPLKKDRIKHRVCIALSMKASYPGANTNPPHLREGARHD